MALQGVNFIHYKDILEDMDLVDHIITLENEFHAKSRFQESLDSAGFIDATGGVGKLIKQGYANLKSSLWTYKLYVLFLV